METNLLKKENKYVTLSFPRKRESRVKCKNPGSPIKSGMTLSAVLFCSVFGFVFLSLLLFPTQSAQAATKTWSGAVSNLWNVAGNWDALPIAGDDLVFPLTPTGNKSNSNDFPADTSFNSITIQGTGYTLAGNRITLGAGGITHATGTGSNTISLAIVLGANVTVSMVSGTNLYLDGIISDGGSGYSVTKISAVDGSFNWKALWLRNINTFSGGLVIKSGVVLADHNKWGSGPVTIGDTGGPLPAQMYMTSTGTVPNQIIAGSGSSGALSITSPAGSTLAGGILLANDLTLESTSNSIVVQSGVTGTGNLILRSYSTGFIRIETGTVNHIGTITNSGTGTGTTTISAVIGTNVTGVIQNSTTSQLNLSGANTFTSGLTIKAGTVALTTSTSAGGGSGTGTITIGDSSGTANATLTGTSTTTFANPITVASGSSGVLSLDRTGGYITFSGAISLSNNLTIHNSVPGGTGSITITGGISGTGNIVISGGGSASTVVLSNGSINNVGTIINNGATTGATTISAVIGTNVTGVIQNSATSQLTLSGTNTFTSGVTVKAGDVYASSSAAYGNGGTITLGDSSGSAGARLRTNTNSSFVNPITVASGSSGSLEIYTGDGANSVTYSGLITLANNLSLTGANGVTISGGISGTGNLIINKTTPNNVTFSTASLNHAGTITNSGTGTGTTTISAVIGTNVTGVIQNSATSQLDLSGANTFTSGLRVLAGTVRAVGSSTNNQFGGNANQVTLGDTSGVADATLWGNHNMVYPQPIAVVSGSSGIAKIMAQATYPTFSGGIVLSKDLLVTTTGAGAIGLTGGITGTGNVTITGSASGTVNFATNPINHTGTITNSGTGTGTTTISAVIGTNVTGITQNSSTSKLLLSGNNSNTENVTISAGTLELSGSTNLNVRGNFSNSGTFTANTGTVTLTGTNQSITGNTTFNNLTFTPGQTITFQASSTQTISNTLTCQGSAGNIITLASSNTTPAILSKSSGQVVCDYLNIGYSTAQGGATWNPGTHSTNGGNNTGWDFTYPTTTITAIAVSNNASYTFNTWTNNNVTVTLTCTDNTGGTGCDSSYPKYCTDTTNTCDPTTAGTSYTTPFTISTAGTSFVRYFSQDQVPNIETTQSKTIKIDTTSPQVNAGDNYSTGSTTGQSTQFTQTGTVTDPDIGQEAGSGIATYLWQKVSGPGTITFGSATQSSTTIWSPTDGTYVISLTATDNAGNSTADDFTLLWSTTLPSTSTIDTTRIGGNNAQVPNRALDSRLHGNDTVGNQVQIQTMLQLIEKLKAQIQALINSRNDGNASFQFTSTLKLGSLGTEVKQLQIKLQSLGFLTNTITPNGVFGKATLKAFQDFQANHNITSP